MVWTNVLWRNDNGLLSDWLGQADGRFVVNDSVALQQVDLDWQVAATGDFNGDGRDDILWRNGSGALTNWLGRPDGGFVGNDSVAMQQVSVDWHVVGAGDFNGDGRDDVLWRSDAGLLSDWLGLTNGGFTGNDVAAMQQVSSDWHVVGTGNFDAGGRDDILWRSDSGTLSDWLGLINGGFTGNDAVAMQQVSMDWQIAGIGDFNGDGRDDILWRSDAGVISDWLGQANGGFAGNDAVAMKPIAPSFHIVGTGDFNGDGRDDVLWRKDDSTLETWFGATDGALLSPAQKLWEDALASVSQFFEAISAQIEGYRQDTGPAQDSYHDWPDDYWITGTSVDDIWDWEPNIQDNPELNFYDFLDQEVGFSFDLLTVDTSGFTAAFSGDFGSMADLGGNTYQFEVSGLSLVGTYQITAPPGFDPAVPGDVVVIGHRNNDGLTDPAGYFTFDPMGNGFDFGNHTAPAPTNLPTFSTATQAVAALHALVDSSRDVNAKEHFAIIFKDATGYHISPVYTGTARDAPIQRVIDWMAANNVPYSEVVSLYHNHDSDEYGGFEESIAVNRYPSNRDSEGHGDWPAADWFVQQGADASTFFLSLEDTESVVRNFMYSDESVYVSLSQGQKEQGVSLPGEVH